MVKRRKKKRKEKKTKQNDCPNEIVDNGFIAAFSLL